MRPGRRDATLRRHAGVPEPVGPGEVGEPELLGERPGQPDLLVDLDHAPRAHDPELGVLAADARVVVGQDDGVPRANLLGLER